MPSSWSVTSGSQKTLNLRKLQSLRAQGIIPSFITVFKGTNYYFIV